MKRLAHDLNTLTRVYMAVSDMREKLKDNAERAHMYNCHKYAAGCSYKVLVLGEVLDMINDMVDENYQDLDENGLNKFEQEMNLEPLHDSHDFDPDFAF